MLTSDVCNKAITYRQSLPKHLLCPVTTADNELTHYRRMDI